MKLRIQGCLRAAGLVLLAGLLSLPVAAASALGDTQPGGAASITGIRELTAGARQRIVITLDGNTEIQQACLTRPDRLYFDFHQTTLARRLSLDEDAAKLRKTRQLRLGRPAPDTVRAVLTLKGVANVTAYKTETPARLVIELTPGRAHGSPCQSGSRETVVKLVNAPVIVIDPGHGGQDRGARGAGGSSEAAVALAVGKRLAELLRDSGDAEPVLTRDDDRSLSLGQRTEIARQQKADLFISLHAEAGPDAAECRPQAYYLALTTSRPTLQMASRENAGYDHTVYELPELVKAIMKDSHAEESRRLEKSLASALSNSEQEQEAEAARAPLALLMEIDSPSAFVSLGCLKTPDDGSRLQSRAQERKLARALYRGISDFLREKRQSDETQRATR